VIIVDTSIWIDHLRGIDTPLADILGSGAEMLHPFVHGELLLNGLPMQGEFARQLAGIKAAPVAPTGEVAAFILWAKLAGTGIGYVDTHLLVSARSGDDEGQELDGPSGTLRSGLPAMTIRVGIGGWTYEPWRGAFYPPGHPKKRELEYAGQNLTAMRPSMAVRSLRVLPTGRRLCPMASSSA
jgi:predicted nucleic acid-binding protein